MRWRGLRRSQNVEDRRGQNVSGAGLRLPKGGKGAVGLIVVVIVGYLVGGPELVLNLLGGSGAVTSPNPATTDTSATVRPTDDAGELARAVLASTEDVWNRIFTGEGRHYDAPTLVLFDESVDSACGYSSAASGPFYCPPDRKLYLDLSFFATLAQMGGPGDFAQAYVIGHEVGHHVQNLTGIARAVRGQQQRASSTDANRLQVRMELQADCYAGVWAHHANQMQMLLEAGDVEEGLAAAAAIGDDTLMRNAGRRVTPEAFTHGSSSERKRWLEQGLAAGDVAACDTFSER
jgi:predicted metalloprotease